MGRSEPAAVSNLQAVDNTMQAILEGVISKVDDERKALAIQASSA
jgi:hypothetical protein